MPPAPAAPPASASALLAAVVDYAGLFPPAALDMAAAVAEYAASLAGPDAWMLGRFVVMAEQLPALTRERRRLEGAAPRWQVSAIVRDGSEADVAAVEAFNGEPDLGPLAMVDAIECRPRLIDGIDWIADRVPAACETYVEVGLAEDLPAWMSRIVARGLRAKIRAGGVVAEAFPSPASIVEFLSAAINAGVPFKATAGLHHAVRGAYRLTYADEAPTSMMYGYLNILFATAALESGAPASVAERWLVADDVSSITFDQDAVRWGGTEFSLSLLNRTRRQWMAGFGSCSFREPAGELQEILHGTLSARR